MLITNLVGYFRLPVLRRGYTLLVNLRFTRTLAILLQGGQSLVEGLTLAGRATGSSWAAFLAQQQTESISADPPLSARVHLQSVSSAKGLFTPPTSNPVARNTSFAALP